MIPPATSDRERRRKKNAQRKMYRQRAKEYALLPPVVGLSCAEFQKLFGADANYDGNADSLIAGTKANHRRWEFPLEPAGGRSFPSVSRRAAKKK